MTERLYYNDSRLCAFEATLIGAEDGGRRIYLDRTAFYPDSGGQPGDFGTLNQVRLAEVIDEGERIAHVVETPLEAERVAGVIDWERRFDHMQQHSGQHVLSAAFEALYGVRTVSFHLGAESSTIDLETAALTREQARAVERRASEIVLEGRAVGVVYEDAATATGLRKAAQREGTLRIITIDGLDRSACGGTHVRTTSEIGPVQIRKLDRIRGNVRVEFLCGWRALRRSRADFEALAAAAGRLGAGLDEVPQLVENLREQAKESEKARHRLAVELALRRGAELFAAAQEDAHGVRRHVERAGDGLTDEVRALAQGFTAVGRGIFIGLCENPPAVLYAASAESGIHAGNRLKEALGAQGGRGGGNAQLAQGSLPTVEALQALLTAL
ncbi:MAG: alanyl-tRNA editing protein [Bryobacteraceae bacterium]